MCIFTAFFAVQRKLLKKLLWLFIAASLRKSKSCPCCETLRELINEITTHFCISLASRIVARNSIRTWMNYFGEMMQNSNCKNLQFADLKYCKSTLSAVFILSFVWDMLFHDRILFLDCQHCRCSCKSRQK